MQLQEVRCSVHIWLCMLDRDSSTVHPFQDYGRWQADINFL